MTTLKDIQDTFPGVSERRTQLDAVKAEMSRRQRQIASPAPTRFEDSGSRVLRQMLDAGEPLANLDRRISEQLATDAASDAAFNALRNRRLALEADLNGLLSDASTVFPRLDVVLQEIVEDIAALQPINEILTPEAVLASRRLDDGKRLGELLHQITTLRAEQARILRANADDWPKLSILRLISNPEDVFDDTLIWLRPGHLVHRTSGEQRQIMPPWPWPSIQAAVATQDLALWFIRHGGRMWIPSPSQYDEAAQALRAKAAGRRTEHREGEWVDPGPAQDTPARPLGHGRRSAHIIS